MGTDLMSLRTLMGMVVIVALQATGAEVTDERLVAADGEPHSWLSHGRNYAEDRESPLTQITRTNVAQLGLAWYFDTDTTRGLEATPLVIDGVMYTTGSWSTVFALDAATGALLWSYDPRVPRAWGVNACCDVVNRGVAAAGDNVYLGTLDGRLVALNRHSGDVVWEVLTIDPARPYTITGAPRVVKGNVIIGNGGAEYGVRGYLSAYDAISGDLIWRFYTVPGNPADPYESDAMRLAAATWSGDVYWQVGGGGTVWDSMAYDRGTATSAAPVAATTCFYPRLSPSTRIPASTPGITKRRPAIAGTIPRPSTSFWPTLPSPVFSARY
jgi:quinohemoprotein ethanol dehydrogenase